MSVPFVKALKNQFFPFPADFMKPLVDIFVFSFDTDQDGLNGLLSELK
jgi:hypothetical protein